MIFEIKSQEKINQLVTIFENLKKICLNMNFVIGKNGIYTQGLDPSHICVMELNLKPEWFDNVKLSDKEEIIGLNCESLYKVFKCIEIGQHIKITYLEDSTHELLVYFEGKGHDKMFEISLMDIEAEQLEIPEKDYSADIIMNSADFSHTLSQMVHFGDELEFKLGFDDYIYVKTSGELGTMQVRIKEENITEYALEENFKIVIKYGIKFIEKVCNFSKLNQNINLHISNNLPIKIQYNLSNWKEKHDEDDYTDDNYFKIYLAPIEQVDE